MQIIKDQREQEMQIRVEELERNEVNDEQEQEMISHQDVNGRGFQMAETRVCNNNINRQLCATSRNKLSNKASQTVDMSNMSLKSGIVFLLLLSMVLVGIYKMIEQIYEIQHPEFQLQRRIASSRVNMVRQENSLADRKEQMKRAQTKEQKLGNQKEGLDEVTDKDKNIYNSEKVASIAIKPKKQPLNHQKESSTKRQQAESQLRQKEKYIQQFQNKDKSDKLQSSEIQSNKDEAIDNDKTKVANKELDEKAKVEKDQIQQKVINKQVKSEKKVQAPINTVTQQKPKEQQAPVTQQEVPANTRVPHGKPKQPQTAQTPAPPQQPTNSQPSAQPQQSPKPFTPTSKAGISVQQAVKWKSYQSMIQLPLSAPTSSNPMLLQQYLYYQRKYNISQYPQLPICVVIPTFNNVQNNRYQDNLKSILQQNYTNYHVVVIDDKSQDNTGAMINEYVKTIDVKYKDRIKVIVNQERKMAMPNLRYAAMNQCKEEELFIIVDGDDLLIGRQVFKLFSAVMQERNYWVMWTNFLSPKGAIGYSRQYPAAHKQANNYRKAGFVMSHLRAYYTKLFRLIKDQDLKDDNGEFFHAANDVAIGIPILEMAHKHVGYVPELNYYYNMYTGLNNHKIRLKEQKSNDKLIRKKPQYQALKSLGFGQPALKIDKAPQNMVPSTPTNLKAQNP